MTLFGYIQNCANGAPKVGIVPKLSDAELLTLAVLPALLGFTSETRFLRHAEASQSLQSSVLFFRAPVDARAGASRRQAVTVSKF